MLNCLQLGNGRCLRIFGKIIQINNIKVPWELASMNGLASSDKVINGRVEPTGFIASQRPREVDIFVRPIRPISKMTVTWIEMLASLNGIIQCRGGRSQEGEAISY